jgi:L-iditol 2-dehydrogenase
MGMVQPGRPVLCVGAGPAGNGVAQAALAMGASEAVLIDRSEIALDMAKLQGIGKTVNSSDLSSDELSRRLRTLAPSGFGSVFDTVGSCETIALSLSVLGKAGTLVNLAVHDEEMPINFMSLGSERRIVTSCNFEEGDYPRALAWLEEGKFRVKEWQTRISLDEARSWFDRVTSGPAKEVFKLVIDPWL